MTEMGREWSAEVRRRLGKNLKHLRKLRDWTIYDVSSRSEISWHTIHNWESGKNCPNVDMLIWLCRHVGWRLGDVLHGCNVSEEAVSNGRTE